MQDQPTVEASEASNVELKHLIQEGSDGDRNGSFDSGRIKQPQRLSHLWSGWQKGVAVSCLCNIVVLVLNSALLIWARSKPMSSDGNYILWQGAYDNMKSFDEAIHLGINIASTIILAGSNYALQVLVAPTRKDIDQAHREKRYMDIGISSFHNWRYMSRSRKVLYACLFVVTIPIHLLYNSVVISTAATFEDPLSLVTEDFLQLDPGNASYSRVWDLASNNKMANMSASECLQLCTGTVCEYSNILLFSNLSSTSQNSSWYYFPNYNTSIPWGDCTAFSPPGSWFPSGGGGYYIDDSTDAKMELCIQQNSSQQPSFFIPATTTPYYIGFRIEHCLTESVHFSTIELIPQLLTIVIICNALKIGALCFLVLSRSRPIVTIGDAITSFLDSPDSVTKHFGPISAINTRRSTWSEPLLNTYNKAWKAQDRCFFRAATPLRWWLTLGLCLGYWLIGLALVADARPSEYDFLEQLRNGLGDPVASRSLGSMTLAQSILLANAPQLILSAIYLCYNALFTCIFLSLEWLSYCKYKKGLRVTAPEGEQRGTYFLSLPYKVSVPLGIASMVLHWLLSLSIFVVRVNKYATDQTLIPGSGFHSVATSTLALTLGLIVGGLLIYALIIIGFGKFDSAMPLVRSQSIAISAACHTVGTSEERISTKKLQYGVISELSSGRYRVGFSSGEVRPLIPGEFYE